MLKGKKVCYPNAGGRGWYDEGVIDDSLNECLMELKRAFQFRIDYRIAEIIVKKHFNIN